MNKAELAFKAIDVLGYGLQKAVHFKGITCIKDIPYSKKDGRNTAGDLYFKTKYLTDKTPRPIIVYIHGGGFIKGDKDYRVSVCEYYADRGYYVYCINYRMPPKVVFPEFMDDFIDALNFLPMLKKSYPIDLDNLVLTGDSSGGYICAYLESLKTNDELYDIIGCDRINVEIKGLMLMCGIYDIEVFLNGTKLLGVIPETGTMFFGYKVKNDLSNVKDFKYIDYVSPAKYVNEKWCKTFICSADDDIVCQGQGDPMSEKLKEVGALADFYHCSGIINNHCYHLMLKGNKYAKECMQASAEYLEQIFSEPVVKVEKKASPKKKKETVKA